MIYTWEESDVVCGIAVQPLDKSKHLIISSSDDEEYMIVNMMYKILSPIFDSKKKLVDYLNNQEYLPVSVI